MRKVAKLTGVLVAMALLFPVTACLEPDDNEATENPYVKGTLKVSGQQVWKRNTDKIVTRISEAYLKYSENHEVNAFVLLPGSKKIIGSGSVGSINGGKLSFTVPALEDSDLLVRNDLLGFFTDYWDDVESSETSIKSNILMIETLANGNPHGTFQREGFFGDRTSLACDTILYFYVNKDCMITGKSSTEPKEIKNKYFCMTEGDLSLSLKEGWNLVLRSESYSIFPNGYATFNMTINTIVDPENFKWVIFPGSTF